MTWWQRILALLRWYLKSKHGPFDPDPDDDAQDDTPTPAPDPAGDHMLRRIWKGPTAAYKLVGMMAVTEGILVTVCNVYRGGNRSEIWLLSNLDKTPCDAERIYKGGQETIGQPIKFDGVIYFPVEHGSRVLAYKDGHVSTAGPTKGRWSVCGVVYDGQPCMAYNNSYGGDRTFRDYPVLADARNGHLVKTLAVKAMPRKFTTLKGRVYFTHNFGDTGITDLAGNNINCDAVHCQAFNSRMYVGYGAAWGRDAGVHTADASICRIDIDGDPRTLLNPDSAAIQCMAVIQRRLYVCAIDPDRLYAMDADENVELIAEVKGETAANKARSFGASVCERNGIVFWGRSDNARAQVYAIEG